MAGQRGRKSDKAIGTAEAQVGDTSAGVLARKSKPTGDLPGDGQATKGEGGKRSSESQDIGSFIRAQREAAQVSIRQLAERAGVSAAVFLERVIDHLEEELTDRGLPNWWPAPEPRDGELPIDTA